MTVLIHGDERVLDSKKSSASWVETKVVNSAEGIVEAIVSVTNVIDDVNDIIEAGAYSNTLLNRTPKICWAHDWDIPVAKTLDAVELMPGDPRLPPKIQALGGGGLMVQMQFNQNTQAGRDAFENVKFFGDTSEWSIGFAVPKGGAVTDPKTGIRRISELDLYEASPVLFGANAHTSTLSIKKAIPSHNTSTSDKSWNGSAAEKALGDSPSKSVLRKEYAWVDPDKDADKKTAYKFPHHEVSGGSVGAANIKACQSIIGILNGGRGGSSIPSADRQGVYNHAAHHLRAAGVEVADLKTLEEVLELSQKAADDDTSVADQVGPHEYEPADGSDDPTTPCLVCGAPADDPNHTGEKIAEIEEKPYHIEQSGEQYCVINSSTGKKVPGGCHDTHADALDHMRALYANVEDAKDISGGGEMAGTNENPDPDNDGDDDRVTAPHSFIGLYATPSRCAICRNPANHGLHRRKPKKETLCAEHFTLTISGADATGHCEKEFGHEGPHGFAEKTEEKEMSEKTIVTAPNGEEVVVEKAPDETTTSVSEALTEDFQEKLEADLAKDGESDDIETKATLEEIQQRKADLLVELEELNQALESIDTKDAVIPGDVAENTADNTYSELSTETIGSFLDLKAIDQLRKALVEKYSASQETVELLRKIRTTKAMAHLDTRFTLTDLTDEQKAVAQDVIDAITQIDELVDELMDKLGIPDTDDDAGANDDDSAKTGEVDTETKINVGLNGSYEDTMNRLQAAVGALPSPGDGVEQISYVEATFPDRALVCVAQFSVGEPDADGYSDIEFLGQSYLSIPYTVDGGVVNLGEPQKVDVAGVIVPKALPEVAERTIKAVEDKVGRTLSSTNAEKIRSAVLALVDVLSLAGIDLSDASDAAEQGEKAADDTETSEIETEDKVTISALEIMAARMMSLRAGL